MGRVCLLAMLPFPEKATRPRAPQERFLFVALLSQLHACLIRTMRHSAEREWSHSCTRIP